jgi:hypothetical protein
MVGIDMAIVIPSSKTYDRQNPKVRDNVIERIEVGAVEVVPDNEYETTVYNENLIFDNIEKTEDTITTYEDALALNSGGSTMRNVRGACGLKYILNYVSIPEIYIPKIQKNKFISKIYKDKDENGNPQIKIGLRIRQSTSTGNSSYQPRTNTFDFSISWSEKEETLRGLQNLEYKNDISSRVSSLSVSSAEQINSYHLVKEENNQLKISSYLYANDNYNWSPSTISVDNSIFAKLQNNDITVQDTTIDGVDYYKLSSVKILVGIDTIFMSCLIENQSDFSSVNGYYRAVGSRVLQECEELSITVYGNTIGIDLQDKTVYINGEKQKKVHSVEGNELMQTSNYLLDSGAKAIETMYGETQKEYALGKETATIRCSIGDYYDYKSGEKVIAADFIGKSFYANAGTGTFLKGADTEVEVEPTDKALKMSFEIGDEVIPMVYGADGKDYPMSTYKNGSPKVFVVRGSKIFYDGAIFQEIFLQERLTN